MLPSVSSEHSDFIVIGSSGDRRIDLFQAALTSLGLPTARFVSYLDLIAGRVSLTDLITPASIVRIESPGKSFEVERALLTLGAEAEDPDGEVYTRITRREIEQLVFEKGHILPSRQWYLGYCMVLQLIERQIGLSQVMNRPADIMLMFDKRRSHALLSQHVVAVPPAIGPVRSYNELMALMQERGWWRVFVKLAHGSSASGVVAYRFQGARHQAITTVEMVQSGNAWKLYNSRHIRTYQDQGQIAALIDELCRQRVHVEQWIPKATYANQVFDVRVVVIAEKVRHTVARLSHSPMTNLHLLNKRGEVASVLSARGAAQWELARRNCERAASLFDSLYMGIDLLFTPDFKRHALLEMNAFGDLLPGVLSHDQDTYTAEIVSSLKARVA